MPHEYETRIQFLETQIAQLQLLLQQLQSQQGIGGYQTSYSPPPTPTGGGISAWIGKAKTAIGARVDDAISYGEIEIYSDSSGTLTDMTRSLTAGCATSHQTVNGNGIDAGGWCWVETDVYGSIWCMPLDCT